jgi:taurine--2-oxoglutarate transaminase
MFAIEHFGVVPDIMTCAKGITNGAVPMGAVFLSDKVASFFDDHVLYVGLTYSAHPLACAAGLATLAAFEEEMVLENCQARGVELREQLAKLLEAHESVGDVRSLGLLGVVELVEDKKTREPITDAGVLAEMKAAFEARHLYVFLRWHYILLVPPLVIDSATLAEGMAVLEAVVEIADEHVKKLREKNSQ